MYCFDLTFSPRIVVASAHLNNNATVGTVLGSGVPGAVQGRGRKDLRREHISPLSDVNFGIVFI